MSAPCCHLAILCVRFLCALMLSSRLCLRTPPSLCDCTRSFAIASPQKHKGCDAIEVDNIDCYQNDCIPGMKPYDPKVGTLRNLRFLMFCMQQSRKRTATLQFSIAPHRGSENKQSAALDNARSLSDHYCLIGRSFVVGLQSLFFLNLRSRNRLPAHAHRILTFFLELALFAPTTAQGGSG